MAERAYTLAEVSGGGYVVTWTGLLNGDTGAPFIGAAAADRSIQFAGTFGVGGTIQLKGSNNGTSYVALTDPQGNAISKTAEAIEAITEVAKQVRPEVTAGDGATSLAATMFIKR